jgi:hypothetical protein
MNLKSLLETIEKQSQNLFPEVENLSGLCHGLLLWERDNASIKTPRYKEPYLKMLKYVEKRWREKLS